MASEVLRPDGDVSSGSWTGSYTDLGVSYVSTTTRNGGDFVVSCAGTVFAIVNIIRVTITGTQIGNEPDGTSKLSYVPIINGSEVGTRKEYNFTFPASTEVDFDQWVGTWSQADIATLRIAWDYIDYSGVPAEIRVMDAEASVFTFADLEAHIDGVGSIAAPLVGSFPLVSSIAGIGGLAAPLIGNFPLVATIAGAGGISGEILRVRYLDATIAGTGGLSSEILKHRYLVATIDGVGGVGGEIVRTDYVGPDALRIYLTGAASLSGAQADPDASLGNYRSSTEASRVGIIYRTPIANAAILMASRVNGVNGQVGSITVADDDQLAYTAPGSATAGPAMQIDNGVTRILSDGEDPSKYVRVTRTSTAIFVGGGLVEFDDQFNNVFGMSNAPDAEHTSGSEKFRAVMLVSRIAITNVKLWIDTLGESAVSSSAQLGSSGSGTIGSTATAFAQWPHKGWAIILNGSTPRERVFYSSRTNSVLTVPAYGRARLGTSAAAGANTDVVWPIPGVMIDTEAASPSTTGPIQTIADEDTEPAGRTWNAGITLATGVSVGSMAINAQVGLWIKRELAAGVAACSKFFSYIKVGFDANGVSYTETLAGLFRVADASLDRYELRMGVDAPPALSDAPIDTFTSLPHAYATPLAAGHTYYLATDRRNSYDLLSQRTDYVRVRVTDDGGVAPAPSPPNVLSWRAGPAGVYVLEATYFYLVDGDNLADFVYVWITTGGGSPDPDIDTPAAMLPVNQVDGTGYFMFTSDPESDGTVGKMVAKTFRSVDSVFSDATAEFAATAATGGLADLIGSSHYRAIGEQL